MGSFSLSGGVEVFGFISPSNTTDQYPVIDPLYGIDGLRNVNDLTELNNISNLRRRAGMIVGVSGGTIFYKLNVGPWNGTITDWSVFSLGSDFTGGTVTGGTIFTNGLSANTISATTYLNLPSDIYVTGYTYNDNTFTIERSSGQPTLFATINDVTGLTVNGDLSVTGTTFTNSISALTYQNLPLDVFVTGGTFSGGDIIFTNNSGGTFSVSGISSFDTFVTGFSYSNNTFTIFQNSGTSLSTTINSVTGLTSNGTINSTIFSGGTYFGDGSNLTGIIRGSGGGRLFYFNLSNTQGPYYEFSPSATTQTEQSITSGSIASGVTSTIAGFLTPSDEPYVTILPGGIWSFYLHCYKEDSLASFDIFCEIYKRTSGGTETLLFQTDPTEVTSNAPIPRMAISDGFYSGTTFDLSDRILVKVNGTNTGTSSKTITFVTEGQIHYSYATTSLYLSSVDTFTTGFTYSDNKLTIQRNEGLSDLSVTINSVTGLTINGNLSVTGTTSSGTISATTYQNLPTDIRVTGGTFSGGSIVFTNNTGGTFNVSGISSFDTFTTGFSYSNNTFTISRNSGSTLTATINTMTGLTVNGNLSVTGNTNVRGITGTTGLLSGSGQSILTIIGSGSTLPLFTIQGSSGELFSVTDSLVGSLFSVNDISGLPIFEVFSDNTVLMGSYLAPSLNTTVRMSASTGTTNIYSIPTSAYTGAFFDYTVSDGTNLRAGNIMSIWSGTSVNFTEVNTTDFGNTSGITFNMVVSSGNAILRTSGTTAGWTVKTIVRSI